MTESHHSESLLRLPGCFLCYTPPAAAPQVEARDPSSPVTFACLNNFSKVTDAMIGTWCRILRNLPESKMLLKADGLTDEHTQADTMLRFGRHGIDRSRVSLVGRTPSFRDHLAAYRDIDISLDSYPYHGTTTTCESLWMGSPVVTLAGTSHRSRVGVSLLAQVGLAELVAHDTDQYVEIASKLATDSPRRRALRADLRQRMSASPLMNAASFVKNLEDAFVKVWQNHA